MTGSLCEVFLEGQENGLVNFLAGGGAGAGRAADELGWGGGDQGIDGSMPDNP